jgi:hypothetical protein
MGRGWVAATGEGGVARNLWISQQAVHGRCSVPPHDRSGVGGEHGQAEDGGGAVVEQPPVQLPARMPVGQRGGGSKLGQPRGHVEASEGGADERGGQRCQSGPSTRRGSIRATVACHASMARASSRAASAEGSLSRSAATSRMCAAIARRRAVVWALRQAASNCGVCRVIQERLTRTPSTSTTQSPRSCPG